LTINILLSSIFTIPTPPMSVLIHFFILDYFLNPIQVYFFIIESSSLLFLPRSYSCYQVSTKKMLYFLEILFSTQIYYENFYCSMAPLIIVVMRLIHLVSYLRYYN